jgi:AMP deaminase
MVLNAGTAVAPQPQPALESQTPPVQTSMPEGPVLDDRHHMRAPSATGSTLDGIEPRIFPGVVSRRRRSSLRGGSAEDMPARSGTVKGEEGAVVEEGEDRP